jgi:hypothetical protein
LGIPIPLTWPTALAYFTTLKNTFKNTVRELPSRPAPTDSTLNKLAKIFSLSSGLSVVLVEIFAATDCAALPAAAVSVSSYK